jgi:hypothetical protein
LIDNECRISGRHGNMVNFEGIGNAIENKYTDIGIKPAEAFPDRRTRPEDRSGYTERHKSLRIIQSVMRV